MSSSASQVAFRTAIAAIYKTSTKEGVFFQDVLGGIRMGSYDNRWSGGTGPIPIAAISSPSLEKESPSVRSLSGEQATRALLRPRSLLSIYPTTKFGLYAQKLNDTIQEYTVDMPWGWIQKANLGDALLGTSLASTAYPGTSRIALVFQKTGLTIQGNGGDGESWANVGLSITNSLARGATPIWLSQYLVSHTPTPYYTVADNRIKEKIWNAGTQVGWVDGTLNIQTIPGSNFNAIACIRGSSMILKAYLQPRSAGICCLGVGW
ncbi:hypothetical protein BKA61DRAFT_683711 [Leptodontidium sp. MPI-SDFR-AT-0119]|nr:hypothetical protein BKA61DRAFT_683711 [Leptodontidium sp. MPI-SDFR-AT-0119]